MATATPDLDLQAVEGIPKDTLVALLRRKDKEAKTLSAKLEKLEERYVKVVRFNKILMEDRTSFLRFCNELLPDSDGVFEEAAAQEIPVNLEALLRRLATWRSTFEAATSDRRIFQQFAELVFPGDEVIAHLFERPALEEDAFDTLQHRWVALEDLHNQSIASINSMARDQMMSRAREYEAAIAGKDEAEHRVAELREQLTDLHRQKAQALTRGLQGGGSAEVAAEPRASQASAGEPAPGGGGVAQRRLEESARDLREARDAAERRAAKAAEAASERERELREELDSRQAEAMRLQRELDRVREENEKSREQARRLVDEKDQVQAQLQARLADLEKELGSNAFIARLAEQQAGRDAEMKQQQKRMDQLSNTVAEIQKLLSMSYNQERVLKDRIRELESSHGRGHVASDYLKHVVLKYVQYTQRGDLKAQTLVPVLSTLLSLSPEEQRLVDRPAIPQPLLIINQAVGESVSWFRGDSNKAEAEATSETRLGLLQFPEGGNAHTALPIPMPPQSET